LTANLLIGLSSVITLGIAAEWLAWRVRLPSILVLLVTGVLVGPLTGFLDPDALLGPLLFPIISISVAIILFEGGASLRMRELREIAGVVRNLVTIGALATWMLASAAAHLALGLPLASAALLGAILVVTGPTVIIPLLRHVRPTPPVASTLKWEGILIDPIGAVLALLVFEAVVAGSAQAATLIVLQGILKTTLIAAALAALGTVLLIVLIERRWVPDFLQSPLALMVVVTMFALSNVSRSESGLLTATLMGVALANQKWVDVKHILEFKENLRVLLISSLFILLAARLKLSALTAIGAGEAAFLAALVFVIRPTAVAAATLGSRLSWRERAVISCVAPRGIVAAAVSSIFAFELLERGFAGADRLAPLTFLVIVATVTVYGLSAAPIARALKVAQPDPQGVLFVGAHPWARAIASELAKEGIPVRLVDTNYYNISEARMAGLPVHFGNVLAEGTLDNLDLHGIGRLLALTSNSEVNSLAAVTFSKVFGHDNVYQLAPEGYASKGDTVLPRHLRGRFLFHPDATYWNLTARFDARAVVKTSRLTETFDYQTFGERYRRAIPLFLLDPSGRLAVLTATEPAKPAPGQRLVAVVDRPESADPGAGGNRPEP
jgi:NhaP-type Na+/H+ or K+/H+ antiporter